MSDNINTMEYWDNRFETDWEEAQGSSQTIFFSKVALQLLPGWIKDDIKERKLTICDLGCAEGQAVDYLHTVLGSDTSGIDFSGMAIEKARRNYPHYRFFHKDISKCYNEELKFDVGYISNVLEHITNPWYVARNIVQYLKEYLLVLIPFRETIQIEEHCNKFDLDSIPLGINEFKLIYVGTKDCADIKNTLYADKQILLVYSSSKKQFESMTLEALVKSFEEEIVSDANKTVKEVGEINENLNLALIQERENIFNLNNKIDKLSLDSDYMKNMIYDLQVENKRLSLDSDSMKNIMNELQIENERLNLDSDYMKNMIYNLQINNERILKSISWRVTKPLRILGAIWNEFTFLIQNHKMFYTKIRNTTLYKKYLVNFVPEKLKIYLMKKYFLTSNDIFLLGNNEQERCVLSRVSEFESNLSSDCKIILVFSGVKYIDSEGQRNIRLVHEAERLGNKIVYAYWRWDTNEELEPAEENMVMIPIDILVAKQVYFFETFFRNFKDKCLLVEFPHPYVPQIVEIANSFGWKTVYDAIDDWEEFSKCGQAGWYRKEVERRISNIVDINIATAYGLRDKISQNIIEEKPYYVITNGVNPDRMIKSKKISKYDNSKGKVQIGYFGHLTDAWFDWNMLKNIAQKHKEWTFHIIGYGEPLYLKVPNNIILYGKKSPEELPKYAAYWNVAIIPFINCDLTKGVNPIKVFEYLQLRLPVVASDMPEIEGYPYVTLAVGEDAFEKAIMDSVGIDMDENKVQQFIEKNTWKKKCIELLNCVDKIEK